MYKIKTYNKISKVGLEVFDDKLVATVVGTVYDGVAIARVESPYAFTLLLRYRANVIVDGKFEKQFALRFIDAERLKRGK